jgi:hypothetical protein
MLTLNQVHTGQADTLLAARQVRQTEALASRRNALRTPFTMGELIAQPLPDVAQCPVYSWAGPNEVPQNTRHPWRN